jgi:hypothetical protein
MRWRTITALVQGSIVGGVLAFVTANLLINAEINAIDTTINGWTTTLKCGSYSNGILLRAACAKDIPAANLPEEAVYWTATVDGAGRTLNGQHDYMLHFPPGGLPPNKAFWALTMGDSQRCMVDNPINRYSVGDRSGLVPNADGSVDIYIQNAAPAGHESNWLPAPTGDFVLWLRAYQPGAAVLSGEYHISSTALLAAALLGIWRWRKWGAYLIFVRLAYSMVVQIFVYHSLGWQLISLYPGTGYGTYTGLFNIVADLLGVVTWFLAFYFTWPYFK